MGVVGVGGGGGGGEGSGWKSMLGTVASMWLLCAFLLSVRVPVIHIETKISDTLYCFCQRAWKSIILDPTHRTPKSSTHCMSLYRFVIYVQDTTKSSVSPAESWAFWEMMSLLRPPHSRVEIDLARPLVERGQTTPNPTKPVVDRTKMIDASARSSIIGFRPGQTPLETRSCTRCIECTAPSTVLESLIMMQALSL